MGKDKKQQLVETLSERLERREINKRNKYVNNENLDNVLRVPLVGGLWYIFRKFKQALYVNKNLKIEYLSKVKLKDQIKNVNLIKESIRSQLNKALISTTIKKFKVPEEYMHEFLIVKEEFPDVVFIHEGNNMFTIVSDDEDNIIF